MTSVPELKSGFVNGKVIKSNSIDIKNKLKRDTYVTNPYDNKSIVNVEYLNSQIENLFSMTNIGGGTPILKGVSGRNFQFRTLVTDDFVVITDNGDYLSIGVNEDALKQELKLPYRVVQEGTHIKIVNKDNEEVYSVDLNDFIKSYFDTPEFCQRVRNCFLT